MGSFFDGVTGFDPGSTKLNFVFKQPLPPARRGRPTDYAESPDPQVPAISAPDFIRFTYRARSVGVRLSFSFSLEDGSTLRASEQFTAERSADQPPYACFLRPAAGSSSKRPKITDVFKKSTQYAGELFGMTISGTYDYEEVPPSGPPFKGSGFLAMGFRQQRSVGNIRIFHYFSPEDMKYRPLGIIVGLFSGNFWGKIPVGGTFLGSGFRTAGQLPPAVTGSATVDISMAGQPDMEF